MGRGVMTHSNAVETVYIDRGSDDEQDQWAWDEFVDDVRQLIQGRYPSFQACDRWEEQECRAILENGLAYVTLSEYCGCVAICLVPALYHIDYMDPTYNLVDSWCRRVGNNWCELLNKAYDGMVRVGTMSNGESVFGRMSG